MENLKISELEIPICKELTPVELIERVIDMMSYLIDASESYKGDKTSFGLLESIAREAIVKATENEKKYAELLKTQKP